MADAVIGADGVHSLVRDIIIGPDKPIHRGRIAYRRDDQRMRVAENQRSPASDVIDVFVFVGIPDVRAFAAYDKRWVATHRTERAHRRVHSAGDHALGALLQTARLLNLSGRCGRHRGSHQKDVKRKEKTARLL